MPQLYSAPHHIPLFSRYHALKRNWECSTKLIEELRAKLAHNKRLDPFCTIAAAGSLGRLEASPASDADTIIIAETNEAAQFAHNEVRKVIAEVNLSSPKADGVFSIGTTFANLTNDIGHADEDLGQLARRMLMLLETKPLYNEDRYDKTIDLIFDRYASYLKKEDQKQFVFLST
jgi:hypothetical protein